MILKDAKKNFHADVIIFIDHQYSSVWNPFSEKQKMKAWKFTCVYSSSNYNLNEVVINTAINASKQK